MRPTTPTLRPPLALLLTLLGACTPEWPVATPPTAAGDDEVLLRVEPEDEGSAVLRLTLEGPKMAAVAPSDVGLFEGPLTDTQLERWSEDDLTDVLRERLVPCTVYAHEGALRVVPHRALRLGVEHTVAVRPDVQLALWTDESAPTPAVRAFPPVEAPAEGLVFAYCVGTDLPAPNVEEGPNVAEGRREIALEPGGQLATVEPLALDPRCVLVVAPPGGGALAHPPRTAFGLDLDPGPLRLTRSEAVEEALACGADEVGLGRACARVEDDRLVVGPSTETALYVFDNGGAIARRVGGPELGFEWLGLEPATTQNVRVAIVTTSGVASLELWVTTLPARPRLEISEVMANPVGPEPQQEWIELHNAGAAPAETDGVELFDAAGSVPLPSFTLAPGERALLVREDFDVGLERAVLDEGKLLRLPSLGGNGLSNEGEALSLRRDGIVLSEAPPEPKPKAGSSVARGQDSATGAVIWSLGPPTPLTAD
jgi:hypothetical protein